MTSDKIKKIQTLKIENDEVEIKELVVLLFANWKQICITTFLFAGIAALWSVYILKPNYESYAVIMPQSEQSLSSAVRGMSGGGGFFAQLANIGVSQDTVRYEQLLRSRTLLTALIEHKDLLNKLEVPFDPQNEYSKQRATEGLVRYLRGGTSVDVNGNVLRVGHQDTNPEISFTIVQGYLEQLNKSIQENSLTQAKSAELFIEDRLKEASENLEQIEKKYLALQQAKGVIELPSQLGLTLSTASNLRSQLIEKEMEIELFKNIMKDSSELQRLESEKQQIEAQLKRLVGMGKQGGKNSKNRSDVEVFTPLGEGAVLSFQFGEAERQYLAQVRLVELLTQQLEIAKIETKKNEPMFEVIDAPIKATLPIGPSKKLITIVAGTLGFILACLFVIFANQFRSLPRSVNRALVLDVKRDDATLERAAKS